MSPYRIHVTKDYLIFCCAHFITHDSQRIEPLHGHNYRAAVTVSGSLAEAGYVYDFVALKRLLRRVVDRLDHRVLLARDNPHLRIQEEGDHVWVERCDGRRYAFPADETVLLPIPNTTAEWLAAYLAERIQAEIEPGFALETIEVEVEETPGQSAFFRQEGIAR